MKESLLTKGKLTRTLSLMLALVMMLVLAPASDMVVQAEPATIEVKCTDSGWEGLDELKAAKSGEIIHIVNTASKLLEVRLSGGTGGSQQWLFTSFEISATNGEKTLDPIPDRYKVSSVSADKVTDRGIIEITLTRDIVQVTNIRLDSTELVVPVGETGQFAATVEPANATNKKLSWSSTNEKIATVDENGVVTAVAPGETDVVVSSKSTPNISVTCHVVVTSKDNSGNEKAPGNFNHDKNQEKGNITGAGLNNTVDELFSRILSPDEQRYAKLEGVNISVWLEVKTEEAKDVSSSDQEKIKKVTPVGYTVPSNGFIDINLWKKIGGESAIKVEDVPGGKVSITVKAPSDIQKSGRTYKIIRLHKDVAEVLTTKQDSNYNLTFETDGFSTYAIAYSDSEINTPSNATSPKTGESQNIPILLSFIGLYGLMGLFVSRKKA